MSRYSNQDTRNYRVEKVGARWVVEQGELTLQGFAGREPAIAYACRSARADADRGWLGLVTVGTTPQEIHCFRPAQSCGALRRPYPHPISTR
jgi:hypothetical protein